jgi:hypothetical protein
VTLTAANGGADSWRGPRVRGTVSAPEPRPPAVPLDGLLLIAALAGALFAQGGYYRSAQWPIGVLLAGALVTSLRGQPSLTSDVRFTPLAACAAVAGWAAARAAVADELPFAIGTVALLASVAVTVLVSRRTPDSGGLGAGAVALGVAVAMTGWLGVAWRISPWALEDQGLWRAATTVTYANAAAGVLAALALLGLGGLVGRRRSLPGALSVCVLFTGLGATMSRGGVVAAAVGAVVLGTLLGFGAVVRAAVAPVLGAAVALAGLVPSMPATSPPRPVPAVGGLVAGLALAAAVAVLEGRRRVGLVVVLVAVLGLAMAFPTAWPGGAAVHQARFTAASPDRVGALRAAVRLAADQPIVGTGPGRATLSWVAPDGRTLVARYAHNEYVQLLVELGAVGLALFVVLVVTVAFAIRDGRRSHPSPPLWAGATAGLVALGTGSGVDFLWHVPAVPLVGALLVGITVPKIEESTQP